MRPKYELPLTFTEPRWRNGLLAVASTAVIVGMGVVIVLVGEVVFGLVVTAAGLAVTGTYLHRTCDPAALTIDHAGISDRSYPRSVRRIAWADIEAVEVARFPGHLPLHTVGLVLRPGAPDLSRTDRIARQVLDLPVDDLLRSTTGSRRRAARIVGVLHEVMAQQPPISLARDGERPSLP